MVLLASELAGLLPLHWLVSLAILSLTLEEATVTV
ncbi:hypothetical protein GBAR_LOCUS27343 [Geodia barretti]|uniref:Uncharacterized protein n=1 Tax=Geodia barretti TaxID=519541 RepID=A0AA35TJX0_GEOBA|nr:hypothetical protein GBAR_LOCUS27343 [Geodia barretti]